jgi:hypothetical protein
MSYEAGEIYFVREVSEGEQLSPFVKIGLVKSPRVSATRLSEHQTGNPRRLLIPEGHIVATDAVSLVEAQLHRRYASNRVGGEWFSFESDKQLLQVISDTRALAIDAEKLAFVFVQADNFQKSASNGETVRATDSDLEIATRLADATAKMAFCKKIESDINEKLKEAVREGEDVGTVQNRTYKPKFDEAAFADKHPEIYSKYLELEPFWYSRFLSNKKVDASESLGAEFELAISEIQSLMSAIGGTSDAYKISEPTMLVTQLKALADWDLKYATAQMKVACGVNEAIEGVCSWKRYQDSKQEFDLKKFTGEHPDFYMEYLTDAVTKEYVLRPRGNART